MPRSKHNAAEKLAILDALRRSHVSVGTFARAHGVNSDTLTASPSRKQVPTMSRKTTFEERIEIVEYVTKHKHSYTEAAEYFQVSYQQARSWVIKAQERGYKALVDKARPSQTSGRVDRSG